MTQKLSLSEKIGMHPQLAIGYLGLLLFMIGDGVESGFLSPYLLDLHFSQNKIALVFTLYGVAAALASWLSGVLSDLLGPKKIMWCGLLSMAGPRNSISHTWTSAPQLPRHPSLLHDSWTWISVLRFWLSCLGHRDYTATLPGYVCRLVLVCAHRRPADTRVALRQLLGSAKWSLSNALVLRGVCRDGRFDCIVGYP